MSTEPHIEIVEIPISDEMRALTDELLARRERELADLTPEQRAAFDEVEERVNRDLGKLIIGS